MGIPIDSNAIAIIGMSGRFPGADSVEDLWEVIKHGHVTARQFSDQELRQAGVSDADIKNPSYIKSGYVLNDVDKFDANLFGFTPKEAATLDPQHRFFLESVWEALEDASYAPNNTGCVTGLFAGSSMSSYYLSNIFSRTNESVTASLQELLANDKDYLCTRTAYKLNLKGPCINVQTACSTSLVAVSQACDSLLDYQCDMAIAGGVTIRVPHNTGYMYEEGNILSPDGHCRTFSHEAQGTVFGSGVGVVVLKRLEDAIKDHDDIYAIIKSTSVNNDGANKIAFAAPAVDGQSEVIAMAQAMADIDPASISYVECHGTGTALGDPIEVTALRQVFEAETDKKNFCALGAIKSNVGHLESAAGISSLIKAVLAIKHNKIPPCKHYQKPNAQINFDDSPFYINNQLIDWPADTLKRAGVSSFGMGGTNAHVILEEAPVLEHSVKGPNSVGDRDYHLLCITAKTQQALECLALKYRDYFRGLTEPDQQRGLQAGNISYTSHVGRSQFNHRLSIVGKNSVDWSEQLDEYLNATQSLKQTSTLTTDRSLTTNISGEVKNTQTTIGFLYTGQGSQYPDMCKDLYDHDEVFRDSLDLSAKILEPLLPLPLIDVLYGQHQSALDQTEYTQAALFAIEMALSALWKSWGVEPDYVLGHSLGEYVAACVSGVMTIAEGLSLVAERGRLMQALPVKGGMLSVLGNETIIKEVVAKFTNNKTSPSDESIDDSQARSLESQCDSHIVEISAYNAPGNLVLSGQAIALDNVQGLLEQAGIKTRRLKVNTGFHSVLVEPMLDEFRQAVNKVNFKKPNTPFISALTGQRVDEEVTETSYWTRHIREAVNFRAGIQTLQQAEVTVLLEIGPAPILLALARQSLETERGLSRHKAQETQKRPTNSAISYLPSIRQNFNNHQTMFKSLAKLYISGTEVHWQALDKGYQRYRVKLPTYAFQRQRYWIDEPTGQSIDTKKLMAMKVGAARIHPLLGEKLSLAGSNQSETWFSQVLSSTSPLYLQDHQVFGQTVFPAAAYIEMVFCAGQQLLRSDQLQIRQLRLQTALVLNEATEVQTVLSKGESGHYEFEIFSRQAIAESTEWIKHVSGVLHVHSDQAKETEAEFNVSTLQSRIGRTHSVPELYAQYQNIGIDYGTEFQSIIKLDGGDGESLAQIKRPVKKNVSHPVIADTLKLDRSPENELDASVYQFHPTLLDGVFQAAAVVFGSEIQEQSYLPAGIESLTFYAKPDQEVTAYCIKSDSQETSGERLSVNIYLLNADNEVAAVISNLHYKKAHRTHYTEQAKLPLSQCCYAMDWSVKPIRLERIASHYMPKVSDMANRLNHLIPEAVKLYQVKDYQKFLTQLDNVSIEYIIQLLNNLGFDHSVTDSFTVKSLLKQIDILPKYHQLLERFLSILTLHKHLSESEGQWQVLDWPSPLSPDQHLQQLSNQYSSYQSEINLLKSCGNNLSKILSGELEATEIIFPDGDISAASDLYHNSPILHTLNSLARSSIQAIIDALPAGRLLRVLEIGAGTGGTTSKVIDLFSDVNSEYYFTDISQIFLSNASNTYKNKSFMRYSLLDIEQDPLSQGFHVAQFDLVIASNVLHATSNLSTTVKHVRRLLSDQGIMLLIEGTEAQIYLDIIFGLTDGWWHYEDTERREDYPLISTTAWCDLLHSHGFSSTESVPSNASLDSMFSSQSLIISKASTLAIEPLHDSYLLCSNDPELIQALSSGFNNVGDQLIVLSSLPGYAYQVDFSSRADIDKALSSIFERHTPKGLLYTAMSDSDLLQEWTVEQVSQESELINSGLLSITQSLVALNQQSSIKLTLISKNSQKLNDNDSIQGLLQAQWWGAARVIRLEFPELNCQCIDLEDHQAEIQAEQIINEIFMHDNENQIAIRDAKRYALRLVRHELAMENFESIHFNQTGSYIVTGGLGGIGKLICSWLINKGAGHVVVLSHRPVTVEESQWLETFNGCMHVVQCDAGSEPLATHINDIERKFGKLKGVFHAAGVLSDGMIMHQDMQKYQAVLSPKINIAWNLHQCTKNRSLDYFVMFSSVASVFGSAGQINHASANSMLDQLAHYRQQQNLPALTINWSAWNKVGAAADYLSTSLENTGVLSIDPDEGLVALEQLMLSQLCQVMVFPVHWDQVQAKQFDAQFVKNQLIEENSGLIEKSEFLKSLEKMDISDRRNALLQHIQSTVARVIGLSVEEIDFEQGFFDLGVDSLTSMDLRAQLQTSLSCYLPTTFVFNAPTTLELAQYMIHQVLSLDFGLEQEDTDNRETPAVQEDDDDSYAELSEEDLNELLDKRLENLDS
ncbi:Polyketide synthase modules and related proteins [hydrothermal vent metagenome]|uniref:Polyketide synthase modules and related proteins n=1 Tax=hydrothermal vent metagenome TaxID=652676 RepID=A0A3B0ZFS6_9ZZZZ